MPTLRLLLVALTAAQTIIAQDNERACQGTTTISSQADATQLASCPTYDGDVVIATSVAETINIASVQEITGALIAEDAVNMTGLGADTLQNIGGAFRLHNAQVVTSLMFPYLTRVDEIDWITVPNLYQLTFSNPGVQYVNSLTIRDTALQNLDGINLRTAGSVFLANNGNLQRVTMQITNVTSNLTINANGNDQLQAQFPNLQSAVGIDLSNIGSIDLSSLRFVNGTAAFHDSAFLKSLAAPNLTMVGDLIVSLNSQLSNISFPVLRESAGGVAVIGNRNLGGTISFPALEIIRGAAIFNGGSFENVALPKLSAVSGSMTLNSTELSPDTCEHYQGIQGQNNVIKGGVKVCNSTEAQASGTEQGGASGSDGGSGSSTSTGAASRVDPIALSSMGLAGLFAAMLGMI